MSQLQCWVHFICGLQEDSGTINKAIKPLLDKQLPILAETCNVKLSAYAIQNNHLHFLVQLSIFQSVGDAANDLRKAISEWSSAGLGLSQALAWQSEYFAASVSHSRVEQVQAYLQQQDELHLKKSFQEEYAEFVALHGLKL